MAQIAFEGGLRHPEEASSIGQGQAALDRGEGTGPVGQSVFAQLGGFDRGDDRGPSRTAGERIPRLERLIGPTQSTQQMGAVDTDPGEIPRPIERLPPIPARRRGSWERPSAEVGPTTRRPPRFLGEQPRSPRGRPGLDRGHRGVDGVVGAECRIEALDRFIEASLATERPGQSGKIATWRTGSDRRIPEVLFHAHEEPSE